MKFKFIGVPDEKHEALNMYGTVFPLNKAVEVTDQKVISKLSAHPHFEAVPEKEAKEAEKKAEAKQ